MSDKIHKDVKKRYGSRLADGKEHQCMHETFSRRSFLKSTGLFSMGALMAVNGFSITQMMPNALTNSLINSDDDRILVLIRFDGGNDGLNTIIHRDNDEYYNIRPTLAIPENNLWALSPEFGMPNTTIPLQPLWSAGRMKIIHNVGYPQPNYSHFRSSDIWASASDSDELISSGWIGRIMEDEFQSFLETPPSVPPAIQIGIENNLIFAGNQANMSLSISNPTEFYRIAQQGQLYDTANLGDCPAESELKYARLTANNAFRYSTTIQEAYRKGVTQANYPNNYLAEQLAIVARLIKGNLGTRVYMVSIGGFDTHAEQEATHPILMTYFSEAVKAFLDDLDASNHSEKVLGMTFSEFGRTIYENGSFGTDHGTGTPIFLFGSEALGGGFVGTEPDLINTDQYGDPYFDVDFRSVYGTVLSDWLGIAPRVVDHALGEKPNIAGLVPEGNFPSGLNANKALLGYRYAASAGKIEIKYSITQGGITKLSLLKLNGARHRTLREADLEAGSYTYVLDKALDQVTTGNYFLELRNGGKVYRRNILVK